MTVIMGHAMMKWILILVATMIAGLMAIATFGCGGGNTPSETVDEFYRLMEKKDCQKVADLVSETSPKAPDTYVNDCKQIADRLVSYSIKRETIDESGFFARVDTEVTINENGKEKTNSTWLHLVKVGDDWKLTSIP